MQDGRPVDTDAPAPGARGRVLVTAPGFDVNGADTAGRLAKAGLAVTHAEPRGNRTEAELIDLLTGAVAAIASSEPFTAAVLAKAPGLRIIARSGVGFDSIDLDAATRAGVLVTTTPGLNDETCADHALALLLAAVRRVVEHDASVRRGEWDRGGALTPGELHGQRVGVLGCGRIGSRVVRRLQGFGTQVKVHDPLADGHGSPTATLEEILAWADILTLHAPLTPATAGIIGARELALMKQGAILVNTSRGGLVDESALLAALTAGHLAGAALDVFEQEPPSAAAFRDLPNVVLSPHIGGLSTGAVEAMARRCVDQVLGALDGRTPDGVVNPEAVDAAAVTGI